MLRPLMAALIAALSFGAASVSAQTYAIQAGRLITDAARPARGPSTVIVEKGRIARIDEGMTTPAGATVIDMRGKTVLPGLVDVHVHLTSDAGLPWYEVLTTKYSEPYAVAIGLKNALVTVRAGFTTVRDVGGPPLASIAMRDALRDGSFPGPRVLVAGPMLSIVGGHSDVAVGLAPEIGAAINKATPQIGVCTGTEACAEAVRKLAALGVDVIKFNATGGVLDPGTIGLEQHFTDAEMKSIIDTAHQLHLKVAAHAHGARGIEAAARAGVDSIEHGTFVDDAGIREMKAHGTYFSATLSAVAGLQLYIGKGVYTASSEAKARMTLDQWGKGLGKAYKAGVPIALGTDAGVFPHGRNGEELGLMVSKAGMTPRDALIAATRGGADLLGLTDQIGTLDPGKSADLIAVDGDPLTDPAAVTHVAYVMVEGRPIPMQ
jgi:imidazolonepropionase-like amidohydrolase